MKYLAILKDSLYEALDSKVLYCMMGLSCLVIVLVSGTSFEPQPAEDGFRSIMERFPGAGSQVEVNESVKVKENGEKKEIAQNKDAGEKKDQEEKKKWSSVVEYHLENFKQVDSSAKAPWEGEYQFDLNVIEHEKGALRLFVWLTSLERGDPELTPEEQEAGKQIGPFIYQAMQMPPEQVRQALKQKVLQQKVDQVTPAQMKRFVQGQLSMHGAMNVTNVEIKSHKGGEVLFGVDAKPRPGAQRTWPHALTVLFGWHWSIHLPLWIVIYVIEDSVVGTYGAGIAMLLSTIITAFFIPNMLRKGAIDLLLAKPIHRTVLLVYKYVGGLAFMFLNTAVIVVGIWLVLGLRSGVWAPGFLLAILVWTFEFAMFYAVSTLFAVLTRSPVVSILITCFAWFILWAVGTGYQALEIIRPLQQVPNWVNVTADGLHYALPRYKDLDILMARVISNDLLDPDNPQRKTIEGAFASIKWGQTLGFSTGWIALLLGLACWRFAAKDY